MWPFGWHLKSSRGFLEVSTRKGPSLTSLSLDWYAGSHLVAVLRSSWATRTLNSSAEDFLAEGAVGRWRSVGREESRGCLWKALLPGGPMLPQTFPTAVSCPRAWVQTQQNCGRVWRRDGEGTCDRTLPEFSRLFRGVYARGRDRASIRTFFPFRCSLRCCYSNKKWLRCWWGKNGPGRFEI